MNNLTEKEYEELETLVENILDILDQGNGTSDDGYECTIFHLNSDKKSKREQLDKIDNLIDEFLSPNIGWNKNEESIY